MEQKGNATLPFRTTATNTYSRKRLLPLRAEGKQKQRLRSASSLYMVETR